MSVPGKALVFGASPQFKLLAGSYVAVFVYLLAHVTRVPAAYVLTAAFAVLPVFAWPAVITLDDVGATSRALWGKRRIIRWTDLRRVVVTPRDIALVANSGEMIRHTMLNARRSVFLGELVRRVPEKVLYRA